VEKYHNSLVAAGEFVSIVIKTSKNIFKLFNDCQRKLAGSLMQKFNYCGD